MFLTRLMFDYCIVIFKSKVTFCVGSSNTKFSHFWLVLQVTCECLQISWQLHWSSTSLVFVKLRPPFFNMSCLFLGSNEGVLTCLFLEVTLSRRWHNLGITASMSHHGGYFYFSNLHPGTRKPLRYLQLLDNLFIQWSHYSWMDYLLVAPLKHAPSKHEHTTTCKRIMCPTAGPSAWCLKRNTICRL